MAKVHRGNPKGGKMSPVFFSNRTAFCYAILRACHYLAIVNGEQSDVAKVNFLNHALVELYN